MAQCTQIRAGTNGLSAHIQHISNSTTIPQLKVARELHLHNKTFMTTNGRIAFIMPRA